jgi:hypothetical protein
MAFIYTRWGEKILIDEVDYQFLASFSWCLDGRGYATTKVKQGKRYVELKMHRLITNAPAGVEIDHINCRPLDNRKKNLRFSTRSQNMANRDKQSNNTSGYKGVYLRKWPYTKRCWLARIRTRGKMYTMGSYEIPQG